MSILTEVIPLEGIDVEADLPCEIYRPVYRLCGKPSEFRVLTSCTCGDRRTCFTCSTCLTEITGGRGICGWCLKPRGIDGFC